MTLAPGTTLGRYQILEPLGSGGMATVYKAYEPSLDRVVALKVIRQGFAEDADFAARFRREAQSVAKLDHPNIVHVHAFDESEGRLYLAMQYLEGGTLKDRLNALEPGTLLPPGEVASIVGQVADALAYAHEQGIVHRDIKPSNIMLTTRGRAVVTDFGIAKIVSGAALTQTGVGIGTPEYMSPEQGAGARVDARADIYSLGVVAYELLTGRVPYLADTPFAIVAAHMRDPLPLPTSINPALPVAAERALLKALAKQPAQRFASATEFASALSDGLRGAPAGATSATLLPTPAAKPDTRSFTFTLPALPRSRPALAAIGAAVLVVVAGTGALVSGTFAGGAAAPSANSTPPPAAAPTVTTITTVRTATPAPSATQTPAPLHAIPPKGALFYQAKLDGTSGDVAELTYDTGSNEQNTPVMYPPGAVEVALNAANLGAGLTLRAPKRLTYVEEVDFTATGSGRGGPGIKFSLRGCAGSNPIALEALTGSDPSVDIARQYPGRPADEITPRTKIPDLADGLPHVMAAVVGPDSYRAYVDEKSVGDGTYPQSQCGQPNTGQLGFFTIPEQFGGGAGVVRIIGARFYELPPVAVGAFTPAPAASVASTAPAATAPPTPAPPPKFAIPAKGALLYQAALDGTSKDVGSAGGERCGDPLPTRDATWTFPNGAIQVDAALGSQVVSCNWFPTQILDPYRFVAEFEVSFKPGSDLQFIFWARGPSNGKLGVNVNARGGATVNTDRGTIINLDPNSASANALRSGGSVVVALVATDPTNYALYVDQKLVGAPVTVSEQLGAPQVNPRFQVQGTGGTLRLLGARFYALPS